MDYFLSAQNKNNFDTFCSETNFPDNKIQFCVVFNVFNRSLKLPLGVRAKRVVALILSEVF